MFALREGIKYGSVDFIASHHQPQHWDDKTSEFEYAKNGMITLEAVFGIAGACGISYTDFIKMQTENIRKIFSVQSPKIKTGEQANLTLFNPDTEYTFNESNIYSKSKNTPFIGKKLKGKTLGIINGDKLFIN
jgi:dihydroorotase